MSKFFKRVASMIVEDRHSRESHDLPTMSDVDSHYAAISQMELTPQHSKEKAPRARQQIYTMWDLMTFDPQIAEALSIHVTAALGGHETTGNVVFISPHARIESGGRRAEQLRRRVEREAAILAPIINDVAFSLARKAVLFGDSYARILSRPREGVVGLISDRTTASPRILPFEQGGQTVGFHALEDERFDTNITELNRSQMVRVKMPRLEDVPQMPLKIWKNHQTLKYDDPLHAPILPAEVGGSFLFPIEGAWRDLTIARAGMNNQQIADSVRQAFIAINVEGMPPDQQKKYQAALTKTLKNYRQQVEEAFDGGEALYGTQWHVLPQWGEKQVVSPIGEMSQRSSPLNDSSLMIAMRRVAGGIGIDLSQVGWADMLAGGIGDGAAFHTSAQMMRRSNFIRPANIKAYNHIMAVHWGLKYGEYFKSEADYPWQFTYYSEQSAAATLAQNNKQAKANTFTMQLQGVAMLQELPLSQGTQKLLLADGIGLDDDIADKISRDIAAAKAPPEAAQPSAGLPDSPQPFMDDNDYE